jgi:hypothetical protein
MKLGKVHWKKFEKWLLSVGCKFISETGDHRKYYKPGILRPIIILNNLRILGISRDEYLGAMAKL